LINDAIKAKLKSNWGDKAEALDCQAELRVYDPLSAWQCYIYAMNPENEDQIMCLISARKTLPPITTDFTISELQLLYNEHGENVQIDTEYRPRSIETLFTKLNEIHRG
jgi:hypothetical protein